MIVAVTGGIDTRVLGVPIRSRDPVRALLAALTLFLLASLLDRSGFTRALDRAAAAVRRFAPVLAVVAGVSLAAHAVVFGTFSAGGADPYGYVDQAYEWASGRLPRPIPLPLSLPAPAPGDMQTPLGYRVGPRPDTMVPTYAPGLPLMMAVSLVAGPCGPFLVVPIFAALFVWLTFRLGERAGGRGAGVVAAAVLVTCPVVLYQAVWPMSDIPSGALWTGAIVSALGRSRRSALGAGLWGAAGLLLRPNLVFAAAAVVVLAMTSVRGRERVIHGVLVCAPLVPVALFVAVLNTMWYGSPSNSGYGAPGEIYALSNVWPNVRLYASWLWQSQSWSVLLAILPLLPPLNRGFDGRALGACVLIAAATFASYVSYAQFEVWWYVRYLMPAFGAFAVLVGAGVVAIARAIPQPIGRALAAAMLCLLAATTLRFASSQFVFGGIRDAEQRYVDIGEFAGDHLPANAVLFAVQHSGSLRFYSGRPTLRFDSIRKEWAAGVQAAIERAGSHPFLIVDDFEIPQVRRQFGFEPDAPLPWPIVARMRELGGVTVFDMATAPGSQAPIALEPGNRHVCRPRRGDIR